MFFFVFFLNNTSTPDSEPSGHTFSLHAALTILPAVVLDEDRERIERPAGRAVDSGRHGVRLGGVRLALVVAATAHRQPPSSSLMRAISAPSSGGLTM